MMFRILASFVLLFSILFFPIWVSAILALALMIYFSFFIEAVFLFLISDLLYGTPKPVFFDIVFISFLIAIIVFIIIELSKKKLRYDF